MTDAKSITKQQVEQILSSQEAEYAYLFPYRNHVPRVTDHVFNHMDRNQRVDEFTVKTMLNVDYIGWTAKAILNLTLFPMQIAMLKQLWNHPFPMLVASRGAGKSFILAVYAILRALLEPGTKIVIVGAGLRQAKLVFNYIEDVWNSAPVLRSIIGGGQKAGPKTSVDLCFFRIGDSIIYALPLGDGCLSGDTLVTYSDRFGTIRDDQPFEQTDSNIIRRNRSVWGNGRFRITDESYCNGVSRTKRISTHMGFEIEGTLNHRIRVLKEGKPLWVRFDQIRAGDCVLVDISQRWHQGKTSVLPSTAHELGIEARGPIPDSMMGATQDSMTAFLSGLFDRYAQVHTQPHPCISLRHEDEILLGQTQYILTHYGILPQRRYGELLLNGFNIARFARSIGFWAEDKKLFLNHVVQEQAHILPREDDVYYDMVVSVEDSECVTFDIHVPDAHEYGANGFFSHNTKIRGFRANVVIADEFASIPEDVFDIVVRGFAATAKNPVEEAKHKAIRKRLKDMNVSAQEIEELIGQGAKGNQIIYSGTAYYAFNHFAKRHDMWRRIIKSGGDIGRVTEIFGSEANIPENFDHRDYSIIRIPYTHVQEGLMDSRQLAHAKAILPSNIFNMEYGAIFVKDSNGFFPRSLIESCCCSPSNPIITPDGEVVFTPMMQGVRGRRYVLGIDPAAERDNLAVTVLELWPGHYRVVYCWAVNKPEFIKRKKNGLVESADYYEYCCHRIKDIIRMFPPERVVMDSQGGGYAIAEMLRNKKLCRENETPIYETIDFDNPKPTDSETDGPHLIQFVAQSPEWNSQSNLFMHKSLETRKLLFPAFDTIKMQAALAIEKSQGIKFDTYEDVVNCIEELKNELCTIQMTQTPTGKEHFDTPSVVTAGTTEGRKKRGRLRKDRYTSILLAHRYAYDSETSPDTSVDYEDVVGNITVVEADPSEGMLKGPGVGQMRNAEWAREDCYGAIKSRDWLT